MFQKSNDFRIQSELFLETVKLEAGAVIIEDLFLLRTYKLYKVKR